jgi:hypothetical protein
MELKQVELALKYWPPRRNNMLNTLTNRKEGQKTPIVI